jgi:hypothetical protein
MKNRKPKPDDLVYCVADPINKGTASGTYTSENLLKTAPNSVTLNYDPALRLYQVAGAGGGVSATTRFGYDGAALIAEYDGSNTLLRSIPLSRYCFITKR